MNKAARRSGLKELSAYNYVFLVEGLGRAEHVLQLLRKSDSG